jgi:hypothetical protein
MLISSVTKRIALTVNARFLTAKDFSIPVKLLRPISQKRGLK